MAKKKIDPAIRAHLEWLGFVQPVGLVVSAPALVRAGAILDRSDAAGQRLLRNCVEERVFGGKEESAPWIPDFEVFARKVLGWNFSPKGYAGTEESPIPDELEVTLPEYSETLRPDYAVRELEPQEGESQWQLLIRVLDPGEDFDHVAGKKGGLEASAHGRMERLLRRTGVVAGLLFNGRSLRLISAPRGESSGWLDFHVADMVQTSGRPISTAMRLLLSQTRLLSLPRAKRLTALLLDSRKFQNEVSESLAEQVLHALYELLRGFQAAHDESKGELLKKALEEHPDEIYRALTTVLLRLVFLLYAEEREMLPSNETFMRYYSVAGLYDRLREDAALYPDTMDQRYGAWAQLLVLFRMLYDGASWGEMKIPARSGYLFDPDRFPFLEGRTGRRQEDERVEAPLVPDGTLYRALQKLLILDGERISYRALDVEQIGSVYETMMGFRLETATGRSIAIKAQKRHSASTTIDLDALAEVKPKDRPKWLKERAARKISDSINKAAKEATSLDDLHAALDRVLDKAATPDLIPPGALVLQPSDERRRSGSHYTPRSLTEPIVRKTLEPILKRLAEKAGDSGIAPAQILDLKICDPAMGSGAFLVEVCRQLADELVEAWRRHDAVPFIPPDEDELLYARRLVAQRCLYGVDKNPMAVDLAKLSIWLATLAKEHPFTFLDHTFRCGDSLVGLTKKQIAHFSLDGANQPTFVQGRLNEQMARATAARRQLLTSGDEMPPANKAQKLMLADEALDSVRLVGDLLIASFFESPTAKGRMEQREAYLALLQRYKEQAALDAADQVNSVLSRLRTHGGGLAPFHWEIEFPEVFDRQEPGFDAFTGNPPFLGGSRVSREYGKKYVDWNTAFYEGAHGKGDLVAHFLREMFFKLRHGGTFGLIATNTVRQGATRNTGLRLIRLRDGYIYSARLRVQWPGDASVIVSIIHARRGIAYLPVHLNENAVEGTESLTAYLVQDGPNDDPIPLHANTGIAFRASCAIVFCLG